MDRLFERKRGHYALLLLRSGLVRSNAFVFFQRFMSQPDGDDDNDNDDDYSLRKLGASRDTAML